MLEVRYQFWLFESDTFERSIHAACNWQKVYLGSTHLELGLQLKINAVEIFGWYGLRGQPSIRSKAPVAEDAVPFHTI
jgi:hypothetical protein